MNGMNLLWLALFVLNKQSNEHKMTTFLRGSETLDHENQPLPSTGSLFSADRRNTLTFLASSFVGITTEKSSKLVLPSNNGVRLLPNGCTPKMIVFDKDGTLTDQTPSLIYWTTKMTENLQQELASRRKPNDVIVQDIAKFHKAIGFDDQSQTLIPSAPLAAGTWGDQIQACSLLFSEMGISEANLKVSRWQRRMKNLHSKDTPVIPDLAALFSDCKGRGLQVAIATSDDRSSLESALSNWGIDRKLIDYSICGNEVAHSKPSTDSLDIICHQSASARAGMAITAAECIVVGDTTADSGMAQNAGAGLMIGVLTGSGTKDQLLESGANVILPDVGQIPRFLDTMDGRTRERGSMTQVSQTFYDAHSRVSAFEA